ncbi:MAG: A/G-specific adenine glycosylase [Rubellimicrobium sp.]|nr:A/G-specific adenine glycosylase [Rubellimicrobium sp.]
MVRRVSGAFVIAPYVIRPWPAGPVAGGAGVTETDEVASRLLAWYDRHARILPWRLPPDPGRTGARADPYRVWLSEVMLQQTTVAVVRDRFIRFVGCWPGVADLAMAADAEVMAEWAGLGYYARARNLLACARAVMRDHGGEFPRTRAALLSLPGIGPYTAAAIAAIAFDAPETVVDGNVERVMARLHDIRTPLPSAKPALVAAAAGHVPRHRPGDHAQALMDLGATVCTPRAPACGLCPLAPCCLGRARGTAAGLPARVAREVRPLRLGHVYVGQRADGAHLLETRPARGLLGGMTGWPGSDWAEGMATPAPPAPGLWHPLNAEVRQVFTHFRLHLAVHVAHLPPDCAPLRGAFVPAAEFSAGALPGVMRKVWLLARQWFAGEPG